MKLKLIIPTPEGEFVASYSECGLSALDFPAAQKATVVAPIKSRSRDPKGLVPNTADVRHWHRQSSRAVKALLAGQTVGEWPPLDLSAGTSFQRTVWEALRRIPAGQTLSYSEIARKIGKPGAARAVGTACGANPIPVLVPCHRVLASGGGLGGFTAGLGWKRKLLGREGVCLPGLA